RKLGSHTNVLDAWQRAQVCNQFLIETDLLVYSSVFLERQIHSEGQHAFMRETRILRLHVMKTAQQQSRSRQQDERQRDLGDHQSMAKPRAANGHSPCRILEHGL